MARPTPSRPTRCARPRRFRRGASTTTPSPSATRSWPINRSIRRSGRWPRRFAPLPSRRAARTPRPRPLRLRRALRLHRPLRPLRLLRPQPKRSSKRRYMGAEPASLELRIDYQFVHAELLRRALTHSSLANESHTGASSPLNDNEQLEFLGDSVRGLLVAEALVRRFPEYREGDLSRLKAHLVCAAPLHGVARRLDLGAY